MGHLTTAGGAAGRSTLYRKLKALGLNRGREAANGEDEAVAAARQPVKIA